MSAVVGIDLGTTNTVVAHVEGGRAVALADEFGEKLIPSVVSFHPSGQVVVGRLAKERRLIDAPNTIYSIKRLIGRAWGSDDVRRARERFPFELREGPGNAVLTVARGETYTLSEISAYVLRKAKAVAEAALGKPVERAVITVPANFNDLQRAATKVAGRVAGLEVMRILNEPTAAALAYGYGKSNAERIAVYDFGGGTFDITLLDLSGNVFEVLATAGDSFLGGDDVDLAIADEMAKAFLKQNRYDPRSDKQVFERVRAAAETLKHQLSTGDEATVDMKEIAHGPGGKPLSLRFSMRRADLDRLIGPLVDRTFTVCKDALQTARSTVKEFDQVILVGGSTRIPLVRQRVAEFFGREPLGHLSPDEVVAIGAAIQAMALTSHERKRGDRSNPPADIDPRTGRPRTLGGLGEAAAEARGRTDPGTGPTRGRTDPGMSPDAPPLPLVGNQGATTARGVGSNRTQLGAAPPPLVVPGAPSSGVPPTTADFGRAPFPSRPDLGGARPPPVPPPRSPMGSHPSAPDLATKPSLGAEARKAMASSPGPVGDTQPGTGPARAPVTDDSVLARLPLVGSPRASSPSITNEVDEESTTIFKAGAIADEMTIDQPTQQRPAIQEEPTLDQPTRRKPIATQKLEVPPEIAMPIDPFGSPPLPDPSVAAPPPKPPSAAPPPPPPARPPMGSSPERIYDKPPPLVQPPPIQRGPGATQVLAAVAAPPAAEVRRSPLAASLEQAPPQAPVRPVPVAAPMAPQIQEMRAPAAPLLVDVTPLSLSVETVGGYCDVIIGRNTPVPCDRTRVFVTAQNHQRVVRVKVAQGESQRFAENTQLGVVELTGIREGLRGEVEISVTFEIDADGILQVHARDVGTGKEAHAHLRLVGLDDQQSPDAMHARQQRQAVV